MKTSLIISTLLASTSAFGVAPRVARSSARFVVNIPEEEMTNEQKEIARIQKKWSEVRMMSKEEAANLEPEWKEAYDKFHEKYHNDLERATELAALVKKAVEPPKVEKKTKGQKRRDAYAKKLEREAARAAT